MRFLLIVTALISFQAGASESVDKAIQIAKKEGYRSKTVDWPATEALAHSIEQSDGENAAITAIVRALGDPHTRYLPPRSNSAPAATASLQGQSRREIAVILPQVENYPVLQINGWSGQDQKQAVWMVRMALDTLRSSNPCGIVLDFSENQGGNMWPMLVGLSPLLSEGKLGLFKAANGSVEFIEKKDGLVTLAGSPHFLNSVLSANQLPSPKWIGIVLGEKTASSGEITPLMFHGQSNVRFFGQETAGFTTSNKVYPLPNGGRLVLTTAVSEDRNGNSFARLKPDEISIAGVDDAGRWLQSKCRR